MEYKKKYTLDISSSKGQICIIYLIMLIIMNVKKEAKSRHKLKYVCKTPLKIKKVIFSSFVQKNRSI